MTIGTSIKMRFAESVLCAAAVSLAGAAAAAPAQRAPRLPCADRAYVTNSTSNSLSVIDTRTNRVVSTIDVGPSPVNPVISPDGRQVLLGTTAGGLTVVDVATGHVTKRELGPGRVSGIRYLAGENRVVVTLLGEKHTEPGHVQILNLDTGALSNRVEVGTQPERIAVSPDGRRAYVVNIVGGDMAVVDLTKVEVIARIKLGQAPFNVLVSPSGDKVYIGVSYSDEITVVDAANNQISGHIKLDSPNGLSFTPDFRHMIVTSFKAGKVSEIDLGTGRVLRSADSGDKPGYIDLTPDGRRGYYVMPAATTVKVFDTVRWAITGSIEVGKVPSVIAVCGAPS